MEKQFRIWVKAICSQHSELVAIDGKTIREAKHQGKSLFHMVSTFCHANGVSLARVRTAEKSNEITAIPKWIPNDFFSCVCPGLKQRFNQYLSLRRFSVSQIIATFVGSCLPGFDPLSRTKL